MSVSLTSVLRHDSENEFTAEVPTVQVPFETLSECAMGWERSFEANSSRDILLDASKALLERMNAIFEDAPTEPIVLDSSFEDEPTTEFVPYEVAQ